MNSVVLFAQNQPPPIDAGPLAAIAALGMVAVVIESAILAFFVACGWKIFSKAGEPGWAAIVPIYNLVVLMKVAGKPVWWFILLFVPCVNIVILIMTGISLAANFGRSALFGLGLVLPPF